MKPDFEHIKKLWDTFDNEVDPGISLAALNQLRALLPRPLFEKLNDGDFDGKPEEFERAFHRYYSRGTRKPSKPEIDDEELEGEELDGEEVEGEELELLPFAGFPQYLLDVWARPHGVGGQGQKVGPLAAIKQWKPAGKGRKARFMFGYRLYRDGERVYQSALQCAIARLNAEQGPQKAQYLADKGRKGKFEK